MLDDAGYHWKADSSQPVEFPEQLFHSKRDGAIDSPSKSFTKNQLPQGRLFRPSARELHDR